MGCTVHTFRPGPPWNSYSEYFRHETAWVVVPFPNAYLEAECSSSTVELWVNNDTDSGSVITGIEWIIEA